jgi:Putative Flp pilus-assembly TadE/G-like
MKARLIRSKAPGQGLPLIALMIVVLVAMVGLAVDVGNNYAEQRNTVRSANAAALSGMNNLLAGGDDTSVMKAIKGSLEANNIHMATGPQPQSGERSVKGEYLDATGAPLASCPFLGGGCAASALKGAQYIHLNLDGKVDTYFARVVGRNDLPVGANAWAARGVCLGIYPITPREALFGPNGFLNPDPGPGGTYSDDTYRNKTVKTLYIHDPVNNPSGNFDWVRWVADAGDKERGALAEATAAMLTGPGNISGGFEEARWPSSNNLNLPEPDGYPLVPGQLTAGDWIYPNTGVSNDQRIRRQLDAHIANKDVLILPIHDAETGSGNTSSYHVSRLAAFVLLGYQLNGQGWFKLAYLGDAPECSTLRQPGTPPNKLEVLGQVLYRPRYRETPASQPPVQYEIILDVSGSMSWTYEGWGWKGGTKYICTGANAGCTGSAYAWKDQTLRRIYFAKNAIKTFIDHMGTKDTMKIVTFSGDLGNGPFSNSRAVTNLTDVYPSGNTWGSGATTATKNALKSSVDTAGSVGGDPYKTDGRTPSAAGLASGTQVFNHAPTKDPNTGETYRRVTIFLTDGVANIRRDGEAQKYTGSCGSEIASCNTGYETNGEPRPIAAMGIEATTLKQYSQIYVIALAGVDETGLSNVASGPNAPFYSTSQNGGDLQSIFDDIEQDVKYGDCVPNVSDWQKTMTESQIGNSTPPLSYPTVGYVYLKTASGGSLPNGQGTALIQVDPNSNLLIYHFHDLPPETYQMEAYVAFKGSDNISRIYKLIFNPNTDQSALSQTIPINASGALNSTITIDPVHLDLQGAVC